MPEISVIIPVKNGEKTLKKCLDSLFMQTVADRMEVIIIDSGSTDKTLEIIKNYNVRLYKIAPEEFSHSRTRNYGVSLAKGDFVVMTVQDAFATDKKCLENALNHFKDPEVMAVAGRQIVLPDKEKNPLSWHRPISNIKEPEKIKFKPGEIETFPPEKKFNVSYLDDVCAVYRKNALLEQPFPDVEFGEDKIWAYEALKKGWTIINDPNVEVSHYHHYTIKRYFRRRMDILKLRHLFGIEKIEFQPPEKLFRKIYYCLFSEYVPEKRLYWLIYNIKIWLVFNAASIFFLFKRKKRPFQP